MKAQSIAKIKAEMEGNKANPYIQLIGDFLLQHLGTKPESADQIMTTGKTIAKSLEAMQTEAKKKQQNGMAMLSDAEGFAIVLKYFGIGGKPSIPSPASVASAVTPAASATASSNFDVSLDDFL